MRNEKEMLDLILGVAKADERIRAVILNGSRVNPHAARDPFRDFDVIYVVSEAASFRRDRDWIRRFGELMILQIPEEMRDPPAPADAWFAFLAQFADGNRIDLTICPQSQLKEFLHDSLSVALLDKDGILPAFPPPDESGYLPKPPTAGEFRDCCNEFWWCSPYVAKGLWRRQIVYAKYFLDVVLRDQWMKMAVWHVGVKTEFSKNTGAYGKYLEQTLEPGLWRRFLRTYSDAEVDHIWEALSAMGELFRDTAVPVAEHFGYEYPHGDDKRVTAHLRHVRALPADAEEMYG
ncbi:MAG: aminoglycoside 6-adenylyltransferase [Anaerolineales bacterium]|nr:aminoglycoside 6-adenylyltransferase [Anaerolineales bacterium]